MEMLLPLRANISITRTLPQTSIVCVCEREKERKRKVILCVFYIS